MSCRCYCYGCWKEITYDDPTCPFCGKENEIYGMTHVSEKELKKVKKMLSKTNVNIPLLGKRKGFKEKLSDYSDKHAMFNEAEILALGLYPNDPMYKVWLMDEVRRKF